MSTGGNGLPRRRGGTDFRDTGSDEPEPRRALPR